MGKKKTLLPETTSKESDETGFLDDRFFPLKTNVFCEDFIVNQCRKPLF